MKLGIMQPYFFPYLGHFQLIAAVDRWVVFDLVKYGRRTWVNRNRILHPTEGWQFISVPARSTGAGTISDAVVDDREAARDRILGQLAHYRRHAPYFESVRTLVEAAFAGSGAGLTDLNVRALRVVCDHLGLGFEPMIASHMELDLPAIEHPGQWALEISSALGADAYVNPSSGREIFRPEEWSGRGISLQFQVPASLNYETGRYKHVPDLSILDVLMWNTPAEILRHLLDTMNVVD